MPGSGGQSGSIGQLEDTAMWAQLNGARRYCLILGTTYIVGAFAMLTVLLTVDLTPELFSLSFLLCVILGFSGPFLLWLVGKEAFMKIGVVERIMERRRIAAAADLAERYQGIDLTNIPEVAALPTPLYGCPGCSRYETYTADKLYWVEEKPLLSAGWYCGKCVDKLNDKPLDERMDLETFLIAVGSSLGTD